MKCPICDANCSVNHKEVDELGDDHGLIIYEYTCDKCGCNFAENASYTINNWELEIYKYPEDMEL